MTAYFWHFTTGTKKCNGAMRLIFCHFGELGQIKSGNPRFDWVNCWLSKGRSAAARNDIPKS
jgi:hypothetical protein